MKAEKLVFSELHKARVLVVGDVMLDRYWYGEVSRISPEAPVPIVRIEADRTKETPGGAANVAVNAAALAGCVGGVGMTTGRPSVMPLRCNCSRACSSSRACFPAYRAARVKRGHRA